MATKTSTKGKAPKKPKYKPLPKAPSMSASLSVWERYKQRAEDVMKENLKRKAEYEKKRKAYEMAKTIREKIKENAKKAFSRLKTY